MKEEIKEKFNCSIECKTKVLNDDKIIGQVEDVCYALIECLKGNNRVYMMGNGGSAADAQHFAAELVGRYMLERKGLPATAFTTDSSILTAIGNDYGYDDVFRRQVEALVAKGDVVFGISTSGNSRNVYDALKLAQEKGAKTVGLLGQTGGKCKEVCDIPIVIDYPRTPNIQEAHEMIIHAICEIVEKKIFE
jgi:D-sedoheptulose 7-phosphate isomerase